MATERREREVIPAEICDAAAAHLPPPTTVVQPPIWVIFPSGRGRGRQVGLSLCIHSGHHLLHGNPFSPAALRVGMHGGDQLFGMSFVTTQTQSLTCKSETKDNYTLQGFWITILLRPVRKQSSDLLPHNSFLLQSQNQSSLQTACQFVQQKEHAEK